MMIMTLIGEIGVLRIKIEDEKGHDNTDGKIRFYARNCNFDEEKSMIIMNT